MSSTAQRIADLSPVKSALFLRNFCGKRCAPRGLFIRSRIISRDLVSLPTRAGELNLQCQFCGAHHV